MRHRDDNCLEKETGCQDEGWPKEKGSTAEAFQEGKGDHGEDDVDCSQAGDVVLEVEDGDLGGEQHCGGVGDDLEGLGSSHCRVIHY